MRACSLILSALLAAAPALAADKAHQHGAARLEITLDGGAQQIGLGSFPRHPPLQSWQGLEPSTTGPAPEMAADTIYTGGGSDDWVLQSC